ncbi:MAG: hypothetical protein QXT13_08545 [Pyrobaculum sp.]
MKTKIFNPRDTVELTILRYEKPTLKYVLPGATALANQIFVAIAYADYIRPHVHPETLDEFLGYIKSQFTKFKDYFGVNVNVYKLEEVRGGVEFNADLERSGKVNVNITVSAYTDIKFTEDWMASRDLAYERYKRYTQTLDEEDWIAIRDTAVLGYQAFIGETDNIRHKMAALKYTIAMNAVDPEYYISRLRDSVEKYKLGYQMAQIKFDRKQNVMIPGLAAARRFIVAFARAY